MSVRPKRARPAARAPTFAEQTSAIDDPTGPMGIRLLVQSDSGRVSSLAVRTKVPTLLLPVHAGIAEIEIGGERHLLDRASWVLVPAGTRALVRAKSPVTHTLALSPSVELRAAVVRAYGGEIQLTRFDRYVSVVQVMPRTTWVNELSHRYLFERAVCKKRDNVATAFLEMELVKELYFLCHERTTSSDRASVVEAKSDLLQRAIDLVEAHLFEPDVVQRLTRECGASASSLLRTFKRELGHAPLGYVRARRLDESLLLLKAKRYAVGEVATMVGYQSFAAFSQAFRARFGMKPSHVSG
jgi:AraC-like DNA-binding protein